MVKLMFAAIPAAILFGLLMLLFQFAGLALFSGLLGVGTVSSN